MKTKMSLFSSLILMVAFGVAYAEQNFEIKNDLFYENINAPAKQIYQQKLSENGDVLLSLTVTFNQNGYYDNFDFDGGDLIMDFDNYNNTQRQITLLSQDAKSVINSQWVSVDSHYSTDGDMKIDTRLDDQGNVIYQKTFFDSDPELTEIIHYRYLKDGEEKSQALIDNLQEGEQLSFITTLERDQYGSWTKQREEQQDGVIKFHTRSIDYAISTP